MEKHINVPLLLRPIAGLVFFVVLVLSLLLTFVKRLFGALKVAGVFTMSGKLVIYYSKKQDAPRCRHNISGNDCFICFPTGNKGA